MKLPLGIDLQQYKTQAKELLRRVRDGQADALERLRLHHPEHSQLALSGKVGLADAQLVLSRENGFPSWAKFKNDLIFRNAVQAMADGDLRKLESLLNDHSFLPRYRARFGEPYEAGYFSGATLLMHIASNPDIHPISENIEDITRLILRFGFEKKDAEYTIGLLLTSRQASEAGVAVRLIQMLSEAGARFDPGKSGTLDGPLLNLAPETASSLLSMGAKLELRHAAGLGRLGELAAGLGAASQEELELALVFACVRGQGEAARMLSEAGAKGDVLLTYGGMQARTALHEAANRGFGSIVKMLVEAGADVGVVEPQWGGTPAGWAEAGGFGELAGWLRGAASDS